MNCILKEKAKDREDFFSDFFLDTNSDSSSKISVVVVCHLIDTGIPYIRTIDKYFDLQLIIPKQKSINYDLLDFFPGSKILNISRGEINTTPEVIENIIG